jgi:hypothetical protein
MHVFTPAMVHDLAGLIMAVAVLIKAIWPKGIGKK